MWRYSKWENAKREVEKYKLIETSWPCSLWNLVLCGVGFPVLSFPAIPGSWVFLFQRSVEPDANGVICIFVAIMCLSGTC